jgi:hypothetical protein
MRRSREFESLSDMSPLAKRIVFSWIATDFIWGALLVYALKREKG